MVLLTVVMAVLMHRLSRRSTGGRRLRDGAVVTPNAGVSDSLKSAIAAAVTVIAVVTCPTHDGFEAHLAAAQSHPSGFVGGISSLAGRLQIAVSAESRSWLFFRTGTHRGGTFLGAFGTWVWLPVPSALTLPSLTKLSSAPAAMFCRSNGEGTPHELFALLSIVGFCVATVAPRVCYRHGMCSLNAVRGGRPWVIITANLIHFDPIHLLHSLLSVLQNGPVIYTTVSAMQPLLC